jgi:hypothetical protein
MSIVRRLHVSPWLGAATLMGVVLSCDGSKQQVSDTAAMTTCPCDTASATPAPTFPGPVESAPRESVQAYIAMLHFVEDPEAGDRQALLVGSYPSSARYGPIARIQPERGNYRIPDAQLARGSIISRIINEGSEPYPKLHLLANGTTYVWVEVDSVTGGGRSVFIATNSTGEIDTVAPARTPLSITPAAAHEVFRPVQALARFIWTNDDEVAWSTCSGKCCKSVD